MVVSTVVQYFNTVQWISMLVTDSLLIFLLSNICYFFTFAFNIDNYFSDKNLGEIKGNTDLSEREGINAVVLQLMME